MFPAGSIGVHNIVWSVGHLFCGIYEDLC